MTRDKMTAKEYLRRYKEADRDVRRLRIEYQEELEKIDSLRSSIGDGTPHGGGISKTVEIQALRLIDKTLELKQAELDAIQIRQEVFDLIMTLRGEKKDILYERYIHLKPWEDVAQTVGYSVRQVLRLHGEALNEINMSLNVTI